MTYTTTLETLNHLIAAMDLDYITDEEYLTYRSKIKKHND
ncbi:hypothetical protein QF042_004462 [Pedobacter sp. W3I1]|nr:hypothetical protein [Pedobacter sp. W3I1]